MVTATAPTAFRLQHEALEFGTERLCGLKALQTVQELLAHTLGNRMNPSIARVVDAVGRAVSCDEALQMYFCQPLRPSPLMRRYHIEHLLWHGECRQYALPLVEGADCQSWRTLKALLATVKHPVALTLIVDDLEILGSRGGEEWCHGAARKQLSCEVQAWVTKICRAAEKYFRGLDVEVRCSSEYVSMDTFYRQREAASDFASWSIEDRYGIVETSMELPCQLWRARGIDRMEGLPLKTCQYIACHELVALAAHHRSLASSIDFTGGVLVWDARKEPSPMWPVVISNYDGSGFAPSLAA